MVTNFMRGEGVVPFLLCRLSLMDSTQGGGREAADRVAADLPTWASVMETLRVDDGFHPSSHSIEDLAAKVLRHGYLEKVNFPVFGRSRGGSTNMVTYPCWRHDGIRGRNTTKWAAKRSPAANRSSAITKISPSPSGSGSRWGSRPQEWTCFARRRRAKTKDAADWPHQFLALPE